MQEEIWTNEAISTLSSETEFYGQQSFVKGYEKGVSGRPRRISAWEGRGRIRGGRTMDDASDLSNMEPYGRPRRSSLI